MICWLIDSTPIECARSRETVKRSQLADVIIKGDRRQPQPPLWEFVVYGLFVSHCLLVALTITSPKDGERDIALGLLTRSGRGRTLTVIGDKGYAGREFEAAAQQLGMTIDGRLRRTDEDPADRPHLASIRQRIESIFWTMKDTLTLERHGARTLPGLRERMLARFLTLAACVTLNHQLGRPSRALGGMHIA